MVVGTDRNNVGSVIGSVIVGSNVELELVVVIDVLELLEDVVDDDVDELVGTVLVLDVLVVVDEVLLDVDVGGALVDVLGATVVDVVLLLVLGAVLDDELVVVDVVVGPPSSSAGAHSTLSERTVSVSEPN